MAKQPTPQSISALRKCRHCGNPIIPDRFLDWVHRGEGAITPHSCASNKVGEYAQPIEET